VFVTVARNDVPGLPCVGDSASWRPTGASCGTTEGAGELTVGSGLTDGECAGELTVGLGLTDGEGAGGGGAAKAGPPRNVATKTVYPASKTAAAVRVAR